MNNKRIVILGGGSGGIVAANELRRTLSPEHKIILVDKGDSHLFYPSLLWLIFGWRRAEEIQRDFNLLAKKRIEFLKGTVEKILPDKKTVIVDGRELPYDYLVISLGAEFDKSPFPKTSKIYNFYCLEGAKLVRDVLPRFSSGKIAILIAGIPFKCPAAPYELAFLLDSFFKKREKRQRIEIAIYTPETLPMPTAGMRLGQALKAMLEERNIKFNPGYKFKSIQEEDITFENGKNAKFDLLLVVPPHRAPAFVKEAHFANEAGWIPVERESLKTKFEDVYAIGDITTIKLPGQHEPGKPLNLPKAGVFAHYQAEVVARNIASEICGAKPNKKFSGKGYCIIELDGAKAGFATGNFYTLPQPRVTMFPPLRIWHWARVYFERWWLWRWF